MEVYLRIFINWEQNKYARLVPMAEFTYNNAKNTSTSHTPIKPNYDYHLKMLSQDNTNSRSRSCSADKLAKELRELDEDLLSEPILYTRAAEKSSQ